MPEINKIIFKGIECVELKNDRYLAVVSHTTGGSVLRFRDTKNNIEIFRYKDETTIDEINEAREIWGLPTLFLPNRFDKGVLKTSDNTYQLPVNETQFNNHLHGFVQKRVHSIDSMIADYKTARLVLSYDYDKNDEFYKFMPIDFKISYTFTLSDDGLLQEISLINKSDKMLPVSICTHTCINAPICDDGKEEDMVLSVPIVKKCELNDRCLPTEKLLELNDWDKEYKNGTKMPTLQDISNDMYTACSNTLDGEKFYGTYITDKKLKKQVCNEVSKEFKFWNIWNHNGVNHYFCPEPMTAMINAPNLSLDREISGYKELSNGEEFKCWQRFFTKVN